MHTSSLTTMGAVGCSLWLAAVPTAAQAPAVRAPATFHVDAEDGHDDRTGETPATAWQSLDRVNQAALVPGDTVLFRRGGLWRGSLHPTSGAPGQVLTYGAYGAGPKPILQRSVAVDRPENWEECGPGRWATRRPQWHQGEPLADLRQGEWSRHQENGADLAFQQEERDGQTRLRLECKAPGNAANHVQLWGPTIAGPLPEYTLVRLRVRSSQPFRAGALTLRKSGSPWTTYAASPADACAFGSEWQDVDVVLQRLGSGDTPRLHLYLGGRVPTGALVEIEPQGLWAATADPFGRALPVDVGNIIFDHGQAPCGVKRWAVDDLAAPGDYVYEGAAQRVVLRSDRNPATACRSIELVLRDHVISQGGAHDVLYQDLAIRYGAAHGIGGGNTARITVRHCDLSFIGGGHQMTRPDGKPVRFGNAIEFWNGAEDCLVEGCRIWEVYDAALTNQGAGDDSRQVRITYRNNVIWNSEYSFEYWNRPAEAVTEDILFENNTCVDAGCGWGHTQRPDRNGAHLMFYHNRAATARFVVRNNIFANSTEVCLRLDSDWRAALTLDHNLWYQAEKPLVRFLVKQYYPADELARYRQEVGFDAHSAVAAPQFRNPAARDYGLLPGSPGTTLAHDGGTVGAR